MVPVSHELASWLDAVLGAAPIEIDRAAGALLRYCRDHAAALREARSAQIDRSGILAVTSEKAVFYNSSAIAVAVEEARIVRSRVFMLKTGHAVIDGGTRIGIYAGPAGDLVRPLIDLRGAAAFGAGMGAILLLFGSLLRRMFRAR